MSPKNTKPRLCMRNGALVVSVHSFLFLLLKEANPVMKSVLMNTTAEWYDFYENWQGIWSSPQSRISGISAFAPTSCGESPIVKKNICFVFARLPRRKQRGMRSLFNSGMSFLPQGYSSVFFPMWEFREWEFPFPLFINRFSYTNFPDDLKREDYRCWRRFLLTAGPADKIERQERHIEGAEVFGDVVWEMKECIKKSRE